MTHDIEDLLNLIKELEKRVIELEKMRSATAVASPLIDPDHWYWDH